MVAPLVALGLALGMGVGYNVLGEYARLGILVAKWKAIGAEPMKGKIAEALQEILKAEKSELTGLSSKGAVDCVYAFIDKTIDFALHVDESIATQLFVQMIQQSIAYAIHSSHAGSIGTMANVYSGSMYLSPMVSDQLGANADYFDRYLRAFLCAEVGMNKPSLAFEMVRGANRRTEEIFRGMFRNIDSLLDEWNDLALGYYRHYHSMCRERFADAITLKETATDRAYSLLEQIANEHLSRISEQLDTLDGAKSWFDAGLMSDAELANIALRINLERQASEDNYDDHKVTILDAITNAISTWDAKITTSLSDLTDNETKFNLLVRAIFNALFVNVADFAEMLVGLVNESLEDVNAYRNSEHAIQVTSQFTTVPFPRYELEVFVDSMNPS